MRLFIGFVVLCSLLFLFGGLLAVGIVGGSSSDDLAVNKSGYAYYTRPVTEKYTMKQIDSVSARTNYAFTSANAASTANLP